VAPATFPAFPLIENTWIPKEKTKEAHACDADSPKLDVIGLAEETTWSSKAQNVAPPVVLDSRIVKPPPAVVLAVVDPATDIKKPKTKSPTRGVIVLLVAVAEVPIAPESWK
jgi:hypothetical protein